MKTKLIILLAIILTLVAPASVFAATTLYFGDPTPATITPTTNFNVPILIDTTDDIYYVTLKIVVDDTSEATITGFSAASGNFFTSSPEWATVLLPIGNPDGSGIGVTGNNGGATPPAGNKGTGKIIGTLLLTAGAEGTPTLSYDSSYTVLEDQASNSISRTLLSKDIIISSGGGSCEDECSPAGTTCQGTTSVQTCADSDGDGCLELSVALCGATDCDYLDTACRYYDDVPQTCSAGSCIAGVCNVFTNSPIGTSCGSGQTCDGNGNCISPAQAYILSITKSGVGTGTITSSPAGISCGATCSASFNSGTSVTLTATPDANSVFSGWSGDCSGTGACTISMNANKGATASFNPSAASGPDFIVSSITVSNYAARSGQIDLTFTVQNTGTADFIVSNINPQWELRRFAQGDLPIGAMVASGAIGSLAVGESKSFTRQVLAFNTPYSYKITADSARQINELDETNNERRISLPACADADNDGHNYALTSDCPQSDDCNDNDNTIYLGATELCDNKDNDCDGQTDENFANKGQSCTVGVGACQRTGTYICKGDKTGTECSVQPGVPATEICGNNIDEDCNGADLVCPDLQVTDILGLPDAYYILNIPANNLQAKVKNIGGQFSNIQFTTSFWEMPSEGILGEIFNAAHQALGTKISDYLMPASYIFASNEEKTIPLAALTWTPQTTGQRAICIYADSEQDRVAEQNENIYANLLGGNDNVGCKEITVLECTPDSTRLCPLQQGICEGVQQTCTDGYWDACNYGQFYETEESTCDGVDNDCDGTIDEGCDCTPPDSTRQCGDTDAGVCEFGTQVCEAGTWNECGGNYVGPAEEICDGLDNNCVGGIDEGLTAPDAEKQDGVCAGAKKVCGGINGWIEPVYTQISNYEITEVSCDTSDNDCDGTTDENCACVNGQTQNCGTDVGICEFGTQTCSNGQWGECTDGVEPFTEVCTGLEDEDCDGLTDCSDTDCAANSDCIICTPNCVGKTCGDNGCGGSCGSCSAGYSCQNGACISGCVDDCTSGAKECTDSTHKRTCGNYDSDTCLEWSSSTACGAGETCSNGDCSAAPPTTYILTATKSGTGAGTITSSPAGINCGSDCSETYNSGTSVTLTSAPDAESIFVSWSGDCSGTGTCQLTMTAAKSATAIFNIPTPDLTPPIRSNRAPTGTLPEGTTQATLSLSTDESATCKASTIAGTTYDLMSSTFTTTGGTAHTQAISGLASGNTYIYYIRCADVAGNKNVDDYTITFSIGTSPINKYSCNAQGLCVQDANGQYTTSNCDNQCSLPPQMALTISASADKNGTAPITIAFTGTALGGTGPYNVSWDFGDGNTSFTPGILAGSVSRFSIYTLPGTYAVNYSVVDATGRMANATVPVQIIPPTKLLVKITSPTENKTIELGKMTKFKASISGTDPAKSNMTYIWNTGVKLEPWGTMDLDDDGVEACYKQGSKTPACSGLDVIESEGKFDPNEPGNPCRCKELVDYLYPNSIKTQKEFWQTYTDSYGCTAYGASNTTKCKITLTVINRTDDKTDQFYMNATTSILINLKSAAANRTVEDIACMVAYNFSHTCSANETDKITGSDCCCDTEFELSTDKLSCAEPLIITTCGDGTCDSGEETTCTKDCPTTAKCGDGTCDFGEETTCQQDCHCGNGACDANWMEDTANCPSDCPKKTSVMWYSVLILLIVMALLLLFAWQRGYLSELLNKLGLGAKPEEFKPNLSGLAEKHGVEEGEGSFSKVKAYVDECRERGYSYSQIKDALKRKGWDEETINRAFGE